MANGKILDGFITEKQLAKLLGRGERTVARWRKQQIGPPFVKNGREIFYNVDASRAWLAAGGTAGVRNKARRRQVTTTTTSAAQTSSR